MNDKLQQLIKSFVLLKVLQKAKDTPIDMTAEDAVTEHKHLIQVLQSPSRKDDVQEAKKQKKELKEYKEKLAESDLEKGQNGDWQKEGYSIRVGEPEAMEGHTPDDLTEVITAHNKDGHEVGRLNLAVMANKKGYARLMSIDPAHQRKGLASAMYQHAEKYFGIKMEPGNRSDDAKKLWSQPNRPFGKSQLEKGQNGDWQKEGYTIKHKIELNPRVDPNNDWDDHDHTIFVTAYDKSGKKVGQAPMLFHPKRKGMVPISTKVDPEHQRKGLATAMYQHAEKIIGQSILSENPGGRNKDSNALWNQPNRSFGKNEDLEKVDKPIRQGEVSQDGQYIADIHPSTKKLVWFHHPRIGQANDNFLKLKRNSFISKYPAEYHPVLNQMFDHVLKDPKRHIIAAYDDKDNKIPGIRARHLKSLILGHDHVQLEPVSGSAVNLHLIRHGLGANYNQRQSIQFKTNKLAASELYKSEIKRYLENIDFFRTWKDSYSLNKSEQQPTTLYHYSTHAGLKELDPKFMGTSGVKGDFNRRFDPSKIADYPHTTFAYINDEPEDIVKQKALSKYTLKLEPHQKLYDLSKDHDKLVSQAVQENQGVWNAENVMRKIKDAGYYGVHVSNQDAHPIIRNTVHLFHKHPIHEEEPVV